MNGNSSKIPTAPPLPLRGTSPKGGSKRPLRIRLGAFQMVFCVPRLTPPARCAASPFRGGWGAKNPAGGEPAGGGVGGDMARGSGGGGDGVGGGAEELADGGQAGLQGLYHGGELRFLQPGQLAEGGHGHGVVGADVQGEGAAE